MMCLRHSVPEVIVHVSTAVCLLALTASGFVSTSKDGIARTRSFNVFSSSDKPWWSTASKHGRPSVKPSTSALSYVHDSHAPSYTQSGDPWWEVTNDFGRYASRSVKNIHDIHGSSSSSSPPSPRAQTAVAGKEEEADVVKTRPAQDSQLVKSAASSVTDQADAVKTRPAHNSQLVKSAPLSGIDHQFSSYIRSGDPWWEATNDFGRYASLSVRNIHDIHGSSSSSSPPSFHAHTGVAGKEEEADVVNTRPAYDSQLVKFALFTDTDLKFSSYIRIGDPWWEATNDFGRYASLSAKNIHDIQFSSSSSSPPSFHASTAVAGKEEADVVSTRPVYDSQLVKFAPFTDTDLKFSSYIRIGDPWWEVTNDFGRYASLSVKQIHDIQHGSSSSSSPPFLLRHTAEAGKEEAEAVKTDSVHESQSVKTDVKGEITSGSTEGEEQGWGRKRKEEVSTGAQVKVADKQEAAPLSKDGAADVGATEDEEQAILVSKVDEEAEEQEAEEQEAAPLGKDKVADAGATKDVEQAILASEVEEEQKAAEQAILASEVEEEQKAAEQALLASKTTKTTTAAEITVKDST